MQPADNFNLPTSKVIPTNTEAQSNGLGGLSKTEIDSSSTIGNKINGVNDVQNGLANGKVTHAERYNNGDPEFHNGDTKPNINLRELKIDQV